MSQIISSQVKHYADEASKLRRDHHMGFTSSIWEAVRDIPADERTTMFRQVQEELTRRSTAVRNARKAEKLPPVQPEQSQPLPLFPRPGSVVEPSTLSRRAPRRSWLDQLEDKNDETRMSFEDRGSA